MRRQPKALTGDMDGTNSRTRLRVRHSANAPKLLDQKAGRFIDRPARLRVRNALLGKDETMADLSSKLAHYIALKNWSGSTRAIRALLVEVKAELEHDGVVRSGRTVINGVVTDVWPPFTREHI